MKRHFILIAIGIISLIMLISPAKINAQDEYAAVAETAPAPVGGEAALYKTIDYPDMAKRAKTQGKVYVLVLVNEKGVVDDAKVIKGIGQGCDEEAVSAIKKFKFTPGKNGGVAIKAKLTMAITFKL
jgi:periplasmic protein TonB